MKWIYLIEHKLKAAFCLGLILFVVLWNNIGESKTMVKVGESFNTIYDDRLMAENYLYKMSELLHKGLSLIPDDLNSHTTIELNSQFVSLIGQLKPIIALYDETVLTENESMLFINLKKHISDIGKQFESVTIQNSSTVDIQKNISQIEGSLGNALTS